MYRDAVTVSQTFTDVSVWKSDKLGEGKMDLKQLEYIVTIAESSSVSDAAQRLFISQSGLNQQLVKLERDLGVQLFERGKRHFHITRAGEIYVQNAREILKIKRNTYAELSEIRNDMSGEISLGLTHEHGIDIFTGIYPEFHEKYPGIRFHLLEQMVAEQERLIQDGRLDCGILMMDENREMNFEMELLYCEDLVLGLPLSHPAAKYAAPWGEVPTVIDLRYFKEDTFSLIFASSTMREVLDPFFERAGFVPKILIETAMNHALVQMVSRGFCCTVLPHSRILANPIAKNCAWFRIKGNPHWGVYLARRPNTRMSAAYRYLHELAIRYGEIVEQQFRLDEAGEVVEPML